MLIRFGLSNFKSIYDFQELSLVATKLTELGHHRTKNPAIKELLLPVSAIYGPNASGKSNILEGFEFFSAFIRRSNYLETGEEIRRNAFKLCPEKNKEPSEFIADFILGEEHFQYGFALNDTHILKEWLFSYKISDSGRKTRSVLFDRDIEQENKFYFGKSLRGRNRIIEDLTKDNSLFLSTAAQNNHEQLTQVYKYFRDRLDFRVLEIGTRSSDMAIKDVLSNESILRKVEAMLSSTDIGIKGIRLEEVELSKRQKDMYDKLNSIFFEDESSSDIKIDHEVTLKKLSQEIMLSHEGMNESLTEFKLGEESMGTQSFLSILCPALEVIEEGGVFVIDELDASLHTHLAQLVISIFTDKRINKKGAQLIFSTHDTNLLSSGILRRDEIWITEKDRTGRTVLYPLSDLKVRKDDNLETGYLQGRFGGIPFFSSIDDIVSIMSSERV